MYVCVYIYIIIFILYYIILYYIILHYITLYYLLLIYVCIYYSYYILYTLDCFPRGTSLILITSKCSVLQEHPDQNEPR